MITGGKHDDVLQLRVDSLNPGEKYPVLTNFKLGGFGRGAFAFLMMVQINILINNIQAFF